MKKILSIGDIHGLDVWKEFEDIPQLLTYSGVEPEYDYYVFVGDYVDSFEKSNVEILFNLKEIIEFKRNYPKNVILLLGNHDIQYLTSYKEHGCTGFRPEAYFDLHEIFRKNRELFQLAFQIDNYVWTHAGIHRGWYHYDFPYTSTSIADDLNIAFLENHKSIFQVSYLRGGFSTQGGPLWADKRETSIKPLKGYHQIVGHTRVSDIMEVKFKDKKTSITYIDCLENGVNKPHILTIK